MLTKQSRVRDVCATPIGHDIVHTLLVQTGLPEKAIYNPLVGSLTLGTLQKLSGGKLDDSLLNSILALLNNETQTPPPAEGRAAPTWWKEAVVYQIYPRSFADTNGDGVGDLRGILQKLPYLKELGVNVLWLSPIYDSPNDDNGYDIRNYRKIMEEFGTMEDFDALLEAVHAAGMKLVMDLVVNHTSDEHEWFQESLHNPDGPYGDYYIWQKGTPDTPPNNWRSFFSGSAWNYYPERQAWALHLFSKKQMDLNWESSALRQDVYNMINWWLDKGVDGFRMDVINLISKDSLADGSPALAQAIGYCGIEHYFYGPHLHEYLHEMREKSFGRYDTMTVGETVGVGMEMAKMLTASQRGELDMIFNFDALENPGKSRYDDYRYDLRWLKKYMLNWQQNYGENCWQSLFYDNHDNPRMLSKVNPDPATHPVLAKLLATLQLTLRGTPFLYQGQELGLSNVAFGSIDEIQDVEGRNLYAELCEKMPPEQAFARILAGTRDHARAPMPWSDAPNGGFTTGTPWLRLADGYQQCNAAAQQLDTTSVLHYYRTLIHLRRENPALVYGSFHPLFLKEKRYADLFCYVRALDGKRFYVECNLTDTDAPRPAPIADRLRLLASNYNAPAPNLRPYEANLYEVCNEG
jgi:oligo-1,6-glucosidase